MPVAVDESRILNAALAVWREQGYRNATTRKVAERAEVREVTLFRRFGDKVGLFATALATEAERFQALGARHTGDLEADLVAIVTAYQALLDRNGGIVLDFLVEAPHNAELAKIGEAPLAAMRGVGAVLMRYQAEGVLKVGDPLLQITALLGPLIMRFAVARAQPIFAAALDAGDLVAPFLSGWRIGDESRAEE